MRLGMILESLDTIHVLLMGSNASCLFTENQKKALNEVKEILKNREAERERIIKELDKRIKQGIKEIKRLEEFGLNDSALKQEGRVAGLELAIEIIRGGKEMRNEEIFEKLQDGRIKKHSGKIVAYNKKWLFEGDHLEMEFDLLRSVRDGRIPYKD